MSDRGRYEKVLARQRLARQQAEGLAPYPERITSALDLRGLYGPEVDHELGVEEPTVDLWESGELVPTPEQVERLAKLTDFPVAFFYVEPPDWSMGPIMYCGPNGCEVIEPKPRPAGQEPPSAPVVELRGQR